MMLGRAKTNISAPMARSRRASSKSPTEIRWRVSSAAMRSRTCDKGGPPESAAPPELAGRGTRVPPAGKRPDDLCLAANPDDAARLGEQNRVAGALAQMNDGLQRQRGGCHGKPRLRTESVGIVMYRAKCLGDAVQMQFHRLIRVTQSQTVAPSVVQPHVSPV